jgi:hypothetical protein
VKPPLRAADHGEEAGRAHAIGLRERLDPLLELGLRRVFRIEVRAVRLGRRAGDERLVAIEARPGALVDEEGVQPRAPFGRLAARQIEEHRVVARPHLAQEQRVDDSRRAHQPGEHLPIGGGELREVGPDFDRRKARRHLLERGCLRHPSLLSRARLSRPSDVRDRQQAEGHNPASA